jgi:phosphate transport system protein
VESLPEGSETLAGRLREMAQLVECSVSQSVDAVLKRSSIAALAVFDRRRRVNQLQALIDAGAGGLFVCQPAGVNPAFGAMAAKMGRSLVCMSDLAVGIGVSALTLLSLPAVDPGVDFRRMGEAVGRRLRAGIDAFVGGEAVPRRATPDLGRVAEPGEGAYETLMRFMDRDPVRVHPGLEYVFIVRDLDRLADHAAGIAEDALFFAKVSGRQGCDVRCAESFSGSSPG